MLNINNFFKKIKYPNNIKKKLDYYIIGQNKAKKILSVAIYNHYRRLLYNKNNNKNNIEIDKSNILIIGETGTGKTLLIKTISKILDIPFIIVDATSFTESGYVGEDVESILTRLLQVSNYNIDLAEKGIVYIDEFDKLSRKSKNPSITRDVSGEGVQQSLLKFFENSIVYISPYIGRKHPEQRMIPIKTNNILFIVGGSFEGINNIIENRININKIGYNNIKNKQKIKKNKILNYINIIDLKNFGIIPEIIGRLSIIINLKKLKKKDLKKIIIEPKNSYINQYKELFKLNNINILIDDYAVNYIAEKAIKLNLGARGIKYIFEIIFNKITYNIKKFIKKKIIKINKNLILKIFKKNE
ncbi:MAG: ATP-dependent Clp protease ATP-binding subunit ClpX [Candidatus Shikimatogenerans bostrichidophilus]|nr:MAG: ATP-dependent Clp protease ATP-binding subunit ClpX [Candidatus Shikimatogenerans bostrichidophilus]